MRKPVFRRVIFLFAVYLFVIFFLVLIQFKNQESFNRKIGSLVITGKYKTENKGGGAPGRDETGEVDIDPNVTLFFEGLEFPLGVKDSKNENGNESASVYAINDDNETRTALIPEKMKISENTARFILSDNKELSFYIQSNDGKDSLLISSNFADENTSIELPYKLTKNASIDSESKYNFTISVNKNTYSFDKRIVDNDRKIITLSQKNPVVNYSAVQERGGVFNPSDFIISGMLDKDFYNSAVNQWCGIAMPEWEKAIATTTDENLIDSYIAESIRIGQYPQSLSKVPQNFFSSTTRTYRSSPFVGRLDFAVENLSSYEKIKQGEVQALLQENPAELLRYTGDTGVFKYLADRAEKNLFEQALSNIKTVVPDSINIEHLSGVLEAWVTFNTLRRNQANPFGVFIERSLELIIQNIKRDMGKSRTLFVQNGAVDTRFNLLLGNALRAYGEATGNKEWAAIGRSVVISVLRSADAKGSVSTKLIFSGDADLSTGTFSERLDKNSAAPGRIDAQTIYDILQPSGYYPHAINESPAMFGVWIWTASPRIEANYKSNVLELNVTFPIDKAHYLIIRGIRPFSKIQIRGMDYRTDPRYETYNSPGWAYSAAEQSLMVKLAHRSTVETIKIFF